MIQLKRFDGLPGWERAAGKVRWIEGGRSGTERPPRGVCL